MQNASLKRKINFFVIYQMTYININWENREEVVTRDIRGFQ